MGKQSGFTLIELMVATAILAVMGSMTWVGIDAMFKTNERTAQKSEQASALQVALGQWVADLDNEFTSTGMEPAGWDGKVYRLTRRSTDPAMGVHVVAWAVKQDGGGSYLLRWKSAPINTLGQWKQAWLQASTWARGGQSAGQVKLVPATGMNVHVHTNNAWANAQSSSSTTINGVRLMLQSQEGLITKDWISPTFSKAR